MAIYHLSHLLQLQIWDSLLKGITGPGKESWHHMALFIYLPHRRRDRYPCAFLRFFLREGYHALSPDVLNGILPLMAARIPYSGLLK